MRKRRASARLVISATSVTSVLLSVAVVGCASEPSFPPPVEIRPVRQEKVFAFDTDGDKQPDFWQYQRAGGRKHALAYAAEESSEPGERINLDAIPACECPHFVIALDGVPFELVQELYREGYFRFFHPPSRVICCFPSMSDLALSQLFHAGRCTAYQACYFDPQANRISNANAAYLSASNSPWVEKLAYRCSFWWDGLAYLSPKAVFQHELNGIAREFRSVDSGEACAYSVGTAGLGSRGGREAIRKYLCTVDRLCEQIIYERQGRVKLTLTADHGHNLTECRRVSFRKTLEAGGYRKAKSLRDPRDVVIISYGLVTYAAMFTQDPAGVAECLVPHPDVEFVCHPVDGEIVVRDRAGIARIRKGPNSFFYDSSEGDPLRLESILDELRRGGHVSSAGEIDAQALFHATVEHEYPDPLDRIWAAFHELVEKPPDLIANLRDSACHGSRFFEAMIGKMESTHGSLNRMNSTTFVLSMLGELPPALRSRDVLPALEKLRSERTGR